MTREAHLTEARKHLSNVRIGNRLLRKCLGMGDQLGASNMRESVARNLTRAAGARKAAGAVWRVEP